jgi:hypothetical protein
VNVVDSDDAIYDAYSMAALNNRANADNARDAIRRVKSAPFL